MQDAEQKSIELVSKLEHTKKEKDRLLDSLIEAEYVALNTLSIHSQWLFSRNCDPLRPLVFHQLGSLAVGVVG